MLERDFQKIVIKLAEAEGYKVYHVANAKNQLRSETSRGFPDLILLKHKMLVWECKVPPNKCSQEQIEWLNNFQSLGIETAVITPDSWDYIIGNLCDKPSRLIVLNHYLQQLRSELHGE